jgi:hypothetical protein
MKPPPNITQLQHRLRKGSAPLELGCTVIEKGAQKIAYLIVFPHGTRYVVKENTGGWKNPQQKRPPDLRKYGCETIYQLRARQWTIQEYVTPLKMRNCDEYLVPESHPVWEIFWTVSRAECGDYHPANFGIRDSGELVCFDW